MATTEYTVRMGEDESGNPIAYIENNGATIIAQPQFPGDSQPWVDSATALAWAEQHAAELNQYAVEAEANRQKIAEREATQDALILQAQEDSKKIAELYEMVKALTNPA